MHIFQSEATEQLRAEANIAQVSTVASKMWRTLPIASERRMTFQRLNKWGICQSSDSWLRIMDDVGGNLESIIKELMNEGQERRVVYDNFDFRITPGQLTKARQNRDNHWISQYVTFDTSGMNNSHSIADLSEFEIFGYLLNEAEEAKLRSDYIILVTRVFVKFISWLEALRECLDHIKHRHSREMARKSIVVWLPVVSYNQNKHADVIKYLEWLQDFFKEIVKDAHQEDDSEDQNLNEDEHMIPIGGDLFGRERITGAKMLRKGCNHASEIFDNMSEVAEFWHTKQAFLSVVWEHLYKIESGRDVGTLYYFRNLFGRNNVKQKVKDGFAPAQDLFLQVFNAYVVAAFMDWTGMMEIQSLPTKVSTPDVRRNQQEKIQYLDKVIGSFVDSFCLALPNVKNAIDKQREQQQQACV
ncbi:uncharacterized protein [Acropora muricata]|uniref:uncharacterized protein isoform X2 n=1 Tax=Acropora muricata TaxID=159855 RepID=UPI0034E4368F